MTPTSVTFRSHMDVDLIDRMGDDSSIVRAARVSTAGEHSRDRQGLSDADVGLIRYLMREKHGTPFEHVVFTFYVHAPIFVFRELMRHRMASYNEESARYRQLEPVFYIPERGRKMSQTGKPGHYQLTDGTESQYEIASLMLRARSMDAYRDYQLMLNSGVAREVARMVLPVSIYSSAYMTVNVRSLLNLLQVRVDSEYSQYPSHPQYEIEQVAKKMEGYLAEYLPVTHAAFVANGRVAP